MVAQQRLAFARVVFGPDTIDAVIGGLDPFALAETHRFLVLATRAAGAGGGGGPWILWLAAVARCSKWRGGGRRLER